MNTFIKLSLTLLSISILSGCVFIHSNEDSNKNWQHVQKKNREVISQLSLNSTRTQIEHQLGLPNFTEAFMKNDQEYRVNYYRTSRQHHDDVTSKDETTPLIFKNNQLIGWGHDALLRVNQ
ncbi:MULTISPECIES: DUF3192 domain-containing protein [unclassified Pseudoalteromonas]|uniref:DUF3192 domain-containing protein n=1 Tax=unclassified Pseudoalteromonas TaxID=194690 RepID=UPI0005A6142B|nr:MULTISPECIES: DUF3192 domain-containing protein [unclassified Pseudoalteromonas]